MNNDRFFDRLREPCPVEVGKRIRLTLMVNDPDPVPIGSEGTVTGGNGAQMYVDWDNGRSLILIPGEDRWTVIG
jgi:outer membrane usher protein FimD/PapC